MKVVTLVDNGRNIEDAIYIDGRLWQVSYRLDLFELSEELNQEPFILENVLISTHDRYPQLLEDLQTEKQLMKSLDSLLQENTKIIARAGGLYEKINSVWKALETDFGILAPVSIRTRNISVEGFALSGIYVKKIGGKWKICIALNGDNEDKATPLTDSNLKLRIGLFDHIQEILSQIVESNSYVCSELEKVCNKINEDESRGLVIPAAVQTSALPNNTSAEEE